MIDKRKRKSEKDADPTVVIPDSLDAAYWRGFGERLSRYRSEAGLTQKELADKMRELDSDIQVSQSLISQTENGQKRMALYSIRRAAEVMGIPLALLISDRSLTDDETQAVVDLFNILEHRGTPEHVATLTNLRNNAKALKD